MINAEHNFRIVAVTECPDGQQTRLDFRQCVPLCLVKNN